MGNKGYNNKGYDGGYEFYSGTNRGYTSNGLEGPKPAVDGNHDLDFGPKHFENGNFDKPSGDNFDRPNGDNFERPTGDGQKPDQNGEKPEQNGEKPSQSKK